MGKAKRAKGKANVAAKTARRLAENARAERGEGNLEQARAEVQEAIAAGLIDPADVHDDGEHISIVTGFEVSDSLREAMRRTSPQGR